MWREWFTLSNRDMRAAMLVGSLILVLVIVLFAAPLWRSNQVVEVHADSLAVAALMTSQEKSSVVENGFLLRPFDPNQADSLELLSVGFPPYVVRNILRYRAAGGMFRRVDDVARVYGLHDTIFARIRPYIRILQQGGAGTVQNRSDNVDRITDEAIPYQPSSEHPYAEYMRNKYKPGKFVNLNMADTAELMKIPGIGPVYAQQIVDYRQALGGFHCISQLREAGTLPEHIGDWVHINAPNLKKIPVNKLSVKQLRSHPYLNYYQAKAIVDLRRREGCIKSVRRLLFLDEFTEADIERLTPYLSLE